MDTIEAIAGRRAINFFHKGFEVPETDIREMLRLASLTPTSYNIQPWKVVVVKSPQRKAVLRKCANDQPKVEEASAVFIVIANPRAVEENLGRLLEEKVKAGLMKPEAVERTASGVIKYYGEPDGIGRIKLAVKNAGFFAMALMLAARGMGYETHPMDGFNEEAIKREFHLPDHMTVPVIIAVGRLAPGVELAPRPFRFPVEYFMSVDDYTPGG